MPARACAEGLFPETPSQGKPPGKTLEDTLKWLGTIIEGNFAEAGRRAARYDSYKYEGFKYEKCFVGWRETHESFEAQTRISKTVDDVTIPLSRLSRSSVRVDKVGESVYVVSFTALKLQRAITSSVESTYQDGSKDKTSSARFGLWDLFSEWTGRSACSESSGF